METTTSTSAPPSTRDRGDLAIVLGGGGARAAYQAGVLRGLARRHPNARFHIIAGVSAGAINATFLASHTGTLREAVDQLVDIWTHLRADDVFDPGSFSLGGGAMRWIVRLGSGGAHTAPAPRGLVDTAPLLHTLRRVLHDRDGEIAGIARNLDEHRLHAVAITALDYATGQTVTWVQGREIQGWERPNRRGIRTRLTALHVMASAALPLFFPAVRMGRSWYGDGGVRLAAPLSPALHLGASRILAISTRYSRSIAEADEPETAGYPPPAQIIGHLVRAIFLDVVDQDAQRMERFNELVRKVPEPERGPYREIDLVVLRPSKDLGRLAGRFESALPGAFRFFTRGLGTRDTRSPDFLSLLMFEPGYLRYLVELGEADVEANRDEIARLVG